MLRSGQKRWIFAVCNSSLPRRFYSIASLQCSARIGREIPISENEAGILLVPRQRCKKSHIFRYLLLGTVQILPIFWSLKAWKSDRPDSLSWRTGPYKKLRAKGLLKTRATRNNYDTKYDDPWAIWQYQVSGVNWSEMAQFYASH